ncbi:hypothetical protein D9757_012225 [Collybiopsis confluens]|uniref:Uncharacterized protein n=1 Tax=Collybiopsis confluens TaxID=2823264 RepID=A0A8H5LRZ3_9AGAR|nr:hypothetical protein D9757_012225 [Collybiopsis confluens]
MSLAKLILGASMVFCGIKGEYVTTITSPPPSATVTLYDVIPSDEVSILQNTSDFGSFNGIYQLTVAMIGVSSGSNGGSETTYSFGRYVSESDAYTIMSTDSQGQVVTETITPPQLLPDISNWTLVASSGGQWETVSPYFTTDSVDGGAVPVGGGYLSCSFDSGHQSAVCNGWDLDLNLATVTSGSQVATVTKVETMPVSYGGMITAYTVGIQSFPVETGNSKSNSGLGRMDWCWLNFGGGFSVFLAFILSL